jgi:hypothetical protein
MLTANALVENLFKISDITGIEPVRPDNASMATTSQESQAYTLALATLSKMSAAAAGATDNDKLESTIANLETEIEGAEISGSMSAKSSTDFATALGTVSLSTDFPSAAAQLAGMGKKSQILTLSTSGLPTGTKIYTIEGTIALPLGNVSLRAEGNGTTLSDVFLRTGVATGIDTTFSLATYFAPQKQVHFRMVFSPSGTGIGIGDFATLAYEVASGATISATDFNLVAGSVAVKDANGADIAGATVTIK